MFFWYLGMALSFFIQSPRRLFDLGVFLCERCVKEQGKGGFATLGFNSATQWAQNHSPPFVWRTIPSIDATFFTVTVSGPTNKLYSPGNTDPAISLAIGSNIAAMTDPGDPQSLKENKEKEAYWNERSTQMTRGSTTAWWSLGPTEAKPEMIYQCDSSLGTPSASDCTAIEWQQLAVQPGTLTVGPEAIFFHVNTCYLAISAAAVIILTWNQIRTAVSALTDTCIQHPYQAAQGGRAYLGPPPTSQDGMRKYKRQNAQLIGWNALPPHVNITMFKQSEPWTNPAAELRTCTWQAALNGRSTLSCTSA